MEEQEKEIEELDEKNEFPDYSKEIAGINAKAKLP